MKINIVAVRRFENPAVQKHGRIYTGGNSGPKVLSALRAWLGRGFDPKWNARAGCSCGCSPGYVVRGLRRDLHVDVS